nr:zinc finger, RING/FYVE/PHD-type [Tanacetum cinerariifolium]
MQFRRLCELHNAYISITSSESNNSKDIVSSKGPSKTLQQWYYNGTNSNNGPSKALLQWYDDVTDSSPVQRPKKSTVAIIVKSPINQGLLARASKCSNMRLYCEQIWKYVKEVTEIDEYEVDELEEITPRVLRWMADDGKTMHGVKAIDDDDNNPMNKCQLDFCPICYQACTSQGHHQICCLPCGHLYGLACIKKWLLQSSSSGNWEGMPFISWLNMCPQCNAVCAYKDVVLLYVSRLCVAAHEKASSTRYFPFTEQGFTDFKEHEWSRHLDAQKRYNDDCKRLVDVVEQQCDLAKPQAALKQQWDDLYAWGVEMEQRAKKLGQRVGELEDVDAFKQQIRALTQLHEALEQRFNALRRHADVLRRRNNVLARRYHAYEPSLKFFNEMYKEHLAQQKKNTSHVQQQLHVTNTNLSIGHYYHASS